MRNDIARTSLFALVLASSTLLQGCWPLAGAAVAGMGIAGTAGIMQTTQTIDQVGDATTNLLNNANSELSATAEQLRQTLASIDTLAQHLTTDADSLTVSVTENLSQLTDELTRQLQGLGELRAQFQQLAADGAQDVSQTLASLEALIQTTTASLQAVNSLLRLSLTAVAPPNPTARAIQVSDEQISQAARDYLATRGQEAPQAPAQATATEAPAATQMPEFTEAAQ